jgi:hypothetical protein
MHQTIFSSKYLADKVKVIDFTFVKDLENKRQLINRWITALESGNLSFSKETQIDLTFLNDIFGEVLGYEYEIDFTRFKTTSVIVRILRPSTY